MSIIPQRRYYVESIEKPYEPPPITISAMVGSDSANTKITATTTITTFFIFSDLARWALARASRS